MDKLADWLLRFLQRGRYKDPRKRKQLRLYFDTPHWKLEYYDEETYKWDYVALSRKREDLVAMIDKYRSDEQATVEFFD